MTQHPTSSDTCAWYLRCSQPSQLLEHQRQPIERFCDDLKITVPSKYRFEDKGGRRHQAEKRRQFQRLLEVIRRESLDWVLVAHMDRWGVANVDEFFGFRSMLREHGVKVWSVTDQLDLTSMDESDRWRIFGQAMANERQMITHAEKNIDKNVQMVRDGWWPSGNHAYGLDLMCCRLSDRHELFRVHLLEFPDRKNKRYSITEYDESGDLVEQRVTKTMPSRNSKQTGYRLVPSVDKSRIRTVNTIFELCDQGMTHSQICDWLQGHGVMYFGRPFKHNTVDAILNNPAYIGKPAWGKSATGYYRQAFGGRPDKPKERRKGESHHRDKSEEDHVQPREPLFDPIIALDLFERVQARLGSIKRTPKPRRRNRSIHPLNGIIVCPDCGKPMVNSHGTLRNGDSVEYFICSTYTRSRNRDCRANSVAHRFLDECTDQLLKQVQSELMQIGECSVDVEGESKILGTAMLSLAVDIVLEAEIEVVVTGESCSKTVEADKTLILDLISEMSRKELSVLVGQCITAYEQKFESQTETNKVRIQEIEQEIDKLGDLLETTPSAQLKKRWNDKLRSLEEEKLSLKSTPNLVQQFYSFIEHAKALSDRLMELKRTREGELWSMLLETVVPIMEIQELSNGKSRTKFKGARFVPKSTATELVGDALEISCNRRGTELFKLLGNLLNQTVYRVP